MALGGEQGGEHRQDRHRCDDRRHPDPPLAGGSDPGRGGQHGGQDERNDEPTHVAHEADGTDHHRRHREHQGSDGGPARRAGGPVDEWLPSVSVMTPPGSRAVQGEERPGPAVRMVRRPAGTVPADPGVGSAARGGAVRIQGVVVKLSRRITAVVAAGVAVPALLGLASCDTRFGAPLCPARRTRWSCRAARCRASSAPRRRGSWRSPTTARTWTQVPRPGRREGHGQPGDDPQPGHAGHRCPTAGASTRSPSTRSRRRRRPGYTRTDVYTPTDSNPTLDGNDEVLVPRQRQRQAGPRRCQPVRRDDVDPQAGDAHRPRRLDEGRLRLPLREPARSRAAAPAPAAACSTRSASTPAPTRRPTAWARRRGHRTTSGARTPSTPRSSPPRTRSPTTTGGRTTASTIKSGSSSRVDLLDPQPVHRPEPGLRPDRGHL